jgi:DNA adenine methylase
LKAASPLRYPGGKWRLARFFERVITTNYERPPVYLEPFAGGASLALTLLLRGFVSEIFLNDLDPAVHAFWRAIVTEPDRFIKLIERTPVSPEEWHKQRQLYSDGDRAGIIRLGFAFFYLNRTSHSGILNGGMIGGTGQRGVWKIDARFNRDDLIQRIRRIVEVRDLIHVSGIDGLEFIKRHRRRGKGSLVYVDPPYFNAGRELYLNAYRPDDHVRVRHAVASLKAPWVVSYDDVPPIKTLYRNVRCRHLNLIHTARDTRVGEEVMFFSAGLRIPRFIPYRSVALEPPAAPFEVAGVGRRHGTA